MGTSQADQLLSHAVHLVHLRTLLVAPDCSSGTFFAKLHSPSPSVLFDLMRRLPSLHASVRIQVPTAPLSLLRSSILEVRDQFATSCIQFIDEDICCRFRLLTVEQ
jgi:hypothetical protein